NRHSARRIARPDAAYIRLPSEKHTRAQPRATTMTDPTPPGGTLDSIIAADLVAEGFEDATTDGRGGFGIRLRCLHALLDRPVAVKVLTTDPGPDNLQRFLREQRAMGRLSGHPNIVNIHDCGTTRGGRPYIVMQYHPQGSLESRIQRLGPIDWR